MMGPDESPAPFSFVKQAYVNLSHATRVDECAFLVQNESSLPAPPVNRVLAAPGSDFTFGPTDTGAGSASSGFTAREKLKPDGKLFVLEKLKCHRHQHLNLNPPNCPLRA